MPSSETPSPDVTVLLVEDDESVREVLRKALGRKGYGVVEASNGAQALEMIDEGLAVDLVITDVVMPQMGGFELVARLAERDSALRVLLISGYTQSDGGLSGNPLLPSGAYFLRKPFSNELLDEMIRQILDD